MAKKKKKELSEHTEEELLDKRKTLKTVMSIILGLAIVALGMLIFLLVEGDWGTDKMPVLTSVFILTLVMMTSKKQMNDIDEELAKRDS
ncbi:MAG: hypothetical protein AAFR66_23930 [Bacteroidota bacterium]